MTAWMASKWSPTWLEVTKVVVAVTESHDPMKIIDIMVPNYWMIVERYSNMKGEFGGLIPGSEIFSQLDGITSKVVNYLLCFLMMTCRFLN